MWLLLAAQAGADPCARHEDNLDAPFNREIGGPVDVDIHLYLNDLVAIKDAEQSFVSDVFMRAEWPDTRLAHISREPCSADAAQLWTPQLQILNRRVIDRASQPDLLSFTLVSGLGPEVVRLAPLLYLAVFVRVFVV